MKNETKINNLLQKQPHGTVWLASWLTQNNISHALQERYLKSGWLETVGVGAFKRKGDKVNWLGALYAIQTLAQKPIHAGGMTALGLQGLAHYLRNTEELHLFAPRGVSLPKWFKDYKWRAGEPRLYHPACLFNTDDGFKNFKEFDFMLRISSPERAILEALYLCPRHMDMLETYQILEGLTNLRPKVMQALLNACTSIKVTRLFLYMAEKANHQWLQFIETSHLNLGSGARSFTKKGVYISKYKITVSRELAEA